MMPLAALGLAYALAGCTAAPAPPAAAVSVELCSETYRGVAYTWVRADPARVRVQAYWRDEHGRPIRSLTGLQRWLAGRGQVMLAGMNGGIFHTDATPAGLLVSEENVQDPLNEHAAAPSPGQRGNFYVQPNGVFFATTDGALHITTTPGAKAFLDRMTAATQSGPLLVQNGRLTPAFRSADTLSAWTGSAAQRARELPAGLPTRNAVCLGRDGTLYLVLTESGVRGDPFARFLRDRLRCRDALFLDGSYSALHVPGRRTAARGDLVTLLAVLPR
ncbi:MAG TPA: phosphodiester glycosidase family protein [Longimicrobium sp.]|nr:phosphodiester glycosidase family protein [Longimicrobium sp.]